MHWKQNVICEIYTAMLEYINSQCEAHEIGATFVDVKQFRPQRFRASPLGELWAKVHNYDAADENSYDVKYLAELDYGHGSPHWRLTDPDGNTCDNAVLKNQPNLFNMAVITEAGEHKFTLGLGRIRPAVGMPSYYHYGDPSDPAIAAQLKLDTYEIGYDELSFTEEEYKQYGIDSLLSQLKAVVDNQFIKVEKFKEMYEDYFKLQAEQIKLMEEQKEQLRRKGEVIAKKMNIWIEAAEQGDLDGIDATKNAEGVTSGKINV